MLEIWETYDAAEYDLCISMFHPDYPALFRMSEADEFFHFCLKEFDRSRVGVAVAVVADDSEMTDVLENEADEEDGGNKKLDLKKKIPEPTYYREDVDDTVDIPMAKLNVKDKPV
jgi:hypothetical protein